MKKIILYLTILFLPNCAHADNTLLWIPYHYSAINDVIKVLEQNPSAKLTIALDQIPKIMETRIKLLEDEGRLEIALRIPGDPPIPLLYYPNSQYTVWKNKPTKTALPDDNPYFMGLRLGLAVDNARKSLKRKPKGLVLPPGGIVPDYFPLAKALGIKWLACGLFNYTDDVNLFPEEVELSSSTLIDVNAQTAKETKDITPTVPDIEISRQSIDLTNINSQNADGKTDNISTETLKTEDSGLPAEEDTETETVIANVNGINVVSFSSYSLTSQDLQNSTIVFDETSEEDPTALRNALKQMLSVQDNKTSTVSDLIENSPAADVSLEIIAKIVLPWTEDYSRWAAKKSQIGALAALAQTRNDLMRFLNSKHGNLPSARPAFDAYFYAEEGRKFMNLGSDVFETERDSEIELRSALANAYRLMEKTPPQWALSSLADAATGESTAAMRITSGSNWFEVKNDQNPPKFEKMPDKLPEKVDPYALWKLQKFKVEILAKNIVFRFTPLALNNSGTFPSGFSHIAADVYIDVNNRPNAGSVKMLPGRNLKIFPENAWEYAIEIHPNATYLYKHTSQGAVTIGAYKAKAKGGEITVTIPRTALRGNPLLWGYAVAMLVPQESNKMSIADTIALNVSQGYIYTVNPSQTKQE